MFAAKVFVFLLLLLTRPHSKTAFYYAYLPYDSSTVSWSHSLESLTVSWSHSLESLTVSWSQSLESLTVSWSQSLESSTVSWSQSLESSAVSWSHSLESSAVSWSHSLESSAVSHTEDCLCQTGPQWEWKKQSTCGWYTGTYWRLPMLDRTPVRRACSAPSSEKHEGSSGLMEQPCKNSCGPRWRTWRLQPSAKPPDWPSEAELRLNAKEEEGTWWCIFHGWWQR